MDNFTEADGRTKDAELAEQEHKALLMIFRFTPRQRRAATRLAIRLLNGYDPDRAASLCRKEAGHG